MSKICTMPGSLTLREQLRLALEALHPAAVLGPPGLDHLHRDGPREPPVDPAVDAAEGAFADHRVQLVAAVERAAGEIRCNWHPPSIPRRRERCHSSVRPRERGRRLALRSGDASIVLQQRRAGGARRSGWDCDDERRDPREPSARERSAGRPRMRMSGLSSRAHELAERAGEYAETAASRVEGLRPRVPALDRALRAHERDRRVGGACSREHSPSACSSRCCRSHCSWSPCSASPRAKTPRRRTTSRARSA